MTLWEKAKSDHFFKDSIVSLQLVGIPVIEDWYVPRGQVVQMLGLKILIHPATMMELRHGGRPPFYTSHMLGVREAERDRRLYR